MDVCLQNRCLHCCIETKPLLNEDLDRIVGMGHYDSYFSKVINGWLVLQTLDGSCVFYEGGKGCTIYDRRPMACRLAPLMYDDERDEVVLDQKCPIPDVFRIDDRIKNAVRNVVFKLLHERDVRMGRVERPI